ncbi:MAG: S8 family serine peptidase [Promethearchaeota archaeon]
MTQPKYQSDIMVIVFFDENTDKEGRVVILDSVFEEYALLYNYDIIPGIALKINSEELISNQKALEEISTIKQISKSNIYKNQYILSNLPQTSDLNVDDYPNWWLSAIGAEDLPYDGTGVKVAIIDSGVYNHPDLNIINNSNFVTDESMLDYEDDVGHGTHVAGIVAGDGIGSRGEYRGVAPGALIINARAGNESLSDIDIIKAIEWSSKPTSQGGAGADIVSMSFGGGEPLLSDAITQAISNAKNDYGVIFVSSAGNSGPKYFSGSTPASGIDVISVGATDENDNLASFSSWGPTYGYIGYPDVVAPGVNIISANAKDSIFSKEYHYLGDVFDFVDDADYIPLSGTSFSCPLVAGALAILLEAYPYITPETARIALLEGARKLSNEYEDDILKSGAGIINVSASLNYLNSIIPTYNDTAKIYPDNLPVKPYDLLNFPGDSHKFNLTVISGKANNFTINIPSNIQGISLTIDKSNINFSDSGIDFIELEIKIKENAIPGVRNFQINLTKGGQIYDNVNIILDIRLPEHRILMESYHGLNDWFPEYSFYQMGFYEAMSDLSELNISIDYSMEYWNPNYNKDLNNSILTEERLSQYDIVFIQNPILPYSPLEIDNLQNYFENGGNILFLGTRYQDLVMDNINYLFSRLGVDIQINEENVMNDNWLGIGASVSSQSVRDFDDQMIFKDVEKFYWLYGNSFTASNNAKSIASLNNQTVVTLYDGSSEERGRFLAFGDLFWIFDRYTSSTYSQDHSNLLRNVIEFFLPPENISININLKEERTSNSRIDLSLYLKNQDSESPITTADFTTLNITIKNSTYSEVIDLNTTLNNNGIYFNNSFNIPYPSYSPYSIELNLTIGSNNYTKNVKLLYYDQNEVPQIINLTSDEESITRALTGPGTSVGLFAELDSVFYDDFEGYLSINSYSFYNTKKSVNKTLTFSQYILSDYRNIFNPETTDPSGYAIYYIIPTNSNYTNPNSPRSLFEIINNPPEILKTSSIFNIDGSYDVTFDETETDEGSYVYSATQGDRINFEVDVRDSVNYEDDKSDMRVFVNLFISVVIDEEYGIIIFPSSIEVSELNYQLASNKYEGSFTIPKTILYNSISGVKSISTESDISTSSTKGNLGVLYFTVYDSEGEYEDFAILLAISRSPIDYSLIIIIVVAIIALIAFTSLSIYYARKRKYPKAPQFQPYYEDYYYTPSYPEQEPTEAVDEPISQLGPSMYCPFCGEYIKTPKKFCPNCGESLIFNQKDD